MDTQTVLKELERLGSEQIKKIYIRHGAKEPLYGVATGAMKPLAKKIGRDYALSMALYDTGNYDAAYFAGIIADPGRMTPADFEHWMESAYCHMMADYVAAVSLAETDFAEEVADRWIDSGKELYMSAGWNCYCWLLGVRPDGFFDKEKLRGMLERVTRTIREQPNWTRYAMNGFIIAVGVSYLPLHEEAVKAAVEIGKVTVDMGKTSCKVPLATAAIQKAADKGRLGFKRRNVRC